MKIEIPERLTHNLRSRSALNAKKVNKLADENDYEVQ